MAELEDKENRSPARLVASAIFAKSATPLKSQSPPKPSKKARSRSIGPEELEASRRMSPDRGRRRSAMTQIIQLPPRGILPAKNEEQKRKEARRKSLANRRVSFAPEATLHTWDVVEYMRDATTSSASSDMSRRGSGAGRPSFATPARQSWEQESDPPSTPPEQADDDQDLPQSPEHQRDVHQKKRRRVSAIPPMNFNNPDDDFSSSPASGSDMGDESSELDPDDEADYDSEDDGESTAMSLDTGDNTAHSDETESTDSSLTARLRQASELAGTRGIDFDEHGAPYGRDEEDEEEEAIEEDNGDMSMEMVTQEVTHAFQPWARQSYGPPPMAKNIIALQDQENMNPFSPAFRHAYAQRKPQGVPSTVGEETEHGSEDVSMDMTRAVGGILSNNQLRFQDTADDDMSMDMTRAVGGILDVQQQVQQEEDNDMSMDITRAIGGIIPSHISEEATQDLGDETMDFTQAIGKIMQPQQGPAQPLRSALKRRLSTTNEGSPLPSASPLQPPQRRTVAQVSAKRRRSSAMRSSLGDATMDFTMAVGGIERPVSPRKEARQVLQQRRRSSGMSSATDEQTMDFTAAIGGIRQQHMTQTEVSFDENEELSMELTGVIGSGASNNTAEQAARPSTPKESLSPARTEVPTTPSREGHFRAAEDQSAKKLLTPMFEKHLNNSAVKDSAGSKRSSPRKAISSPARSPARSVRASLSPQKVPTPRGVTADSGEGQLSAHKIPVSGHKDNALLASSRKTPTPVTKSPLSARKRRQSVAPPTVTVTASPPAEESTQSFSPPKDTHMVDAPAEQIVYPTLPALEPMALPLQASPQQTATHATVSEAGSPRRTSARTPEPINLEEVAPTSPSLDKRMRSSPIGRSVTPQRQSASETATLISPERLQSSADQAGVTPQQILSAMKSARPQKLGSSPIRHVTTPQQDPSAMKSTKPQKLGSSPIRHVTTPQQVRLSPERSVVTPQQMPALQAPATTPQQAPSAAEDASRAISNSIKMMSTPRKDTGSTPLKRLRGMTPMKSPAKKAMTPRAAPTPKLKTPQSVFKASDAELAGKKLAQELFAATQTGKQLPKVKLNDFLEMAGIKFMELALPTKRRFTVAPTPAKPTRANDDDDDDDNDGDMTTGLQELENAIVAGACTMPMLDLFQHSCRELKRYISEGKAFVKTLETEVYADAPPLLSAYVAADAQKRAELDAHMRDVKIHARLGSKEIWYEWRSKLLDGLEVGLNGIRAGLDDDARVLLEREQLLDTLLPDLLAKHEVLRDEAIRLEDLATTTSQQDKEELSVARASLMDISARIEERKRMVAGLTQELDEQDELVEAYTDAKTECLAQIREAERVKESCRGWSISEVAALKASVDTLALATGWTITSASATTLTMTYHSTLSLFFDTSAFRTSARPASTPTNQPISLTYISTSPLQTSTRFFLQFMRAHLQGLQQSTTSVRSLLGFVSSGWDVAETVEEAVRRLRVEFPTRVRILGDERVGVEVDVVLGVVETKVRVGFEVSAAVVGGVVAKAVSVASGTASVASGTVNGATGTDAVGTADGHATNSDIGADGGPPAEDEQSFQLGTHVAVTGKVVYGEAYNEKNMEGFLGRRCGGFGEGWEEAVRELRVRLVATGRKG